MALLSRFMSEEEDDSFRDSRLKVIPKIVEGSWIVSKVANKPGITGNKGLRQAYFRGDNCGFRANRAKYGERKRNSQRPRSRTPVAALLPARM